MMESVDSSPNHMTATRKENYAEYDDDDDDGIISFSSSCRGSAVNGSYLSNNAIKYRTSNNKKMLKSVRSIRRRAKSRPIRSSVEMLSNDNYLGDESHASSPNYLKATSSSEGKKSNFQASPRDAGSFYGGSEQNSSNSSQSKLFSPSVRSVGILLRKSTSFKPRRSLLNHVRVSEDVVVDRATYSSTLKDKKFPKPEIHSEGKELEGDSAVKVCRYHHCSLHGHCHGSEEAHPPPKRFPYKKRRSLKKQKSMTPKSESTYGNNRPSAKKKSSQKSHMTSIAEPMVRELKSGGTSYSGVGGKNRVDSYAEREAPLSVNGHSKLQDFDLSEIAYGETSFPERSYVESTNIIRKYSHQEPSVGGTGTVIYGYCLKCSCSIMQQIMPPSYADANFSGKQVTASSIGDDSSNETPKTRDVNISDARSVVLFKEPKKQESVAATDLEHSDKEESENEGFHKDFPATPVKFDKVTKDHDGFSSASDIQTTNDSNSEGDGESVNESAPIETPKESEVVQVKDDKKDSPTPVGGKLQFSNQRHISMWHLIQQRMSSDLVAEVVNKPQEVTDDEIQADGADSVPPKESSASDIDAENNSSEIQEIELRKLFAIKLVREAIEKILLPEIQDQTSDNQSLTSEGTPRPELAKENGTDAFIQENSGESVADKEETVVPSNPKEESLVADVAPAPDIVKTGKTSEGVSEKKAPRHWSNLKKWILLQRFIKELEKVRKFNPRKPQLLPLHPESDAETVRLRAQTLDERKRAEEWMLDYALRQAVSQLAPTQKKKVALLVKAFETVAPSQEESQIHSRTSRVDENGSDGITAHYKVLKAMAEEDGKHEEHVPLIALASDAKASCLDSVILQKGTVLADDLENASGLNDVRGETLAINRSPPEVISGETEVMEESVISSNDEPEVECGSDEPSSATQSLINGNGKSVISENSSYSASSSDTEQEKTMADDNETRASSGIKGANQAYKTALEREKHVRMWHMIYQHVVTGIAEKVGSKLLDGSDDDDVEYNTTPLGNGAVDFSNSNDQAGKENHHSLSTPKIEFTKSDALKLVKEAMDEILVPEIPDDYSDTQSMTSDFNPEQDISEKQMKFGEGKMSSKDNISTEDVLTSGEERVTKLSVKSKLELPKLKNWSKLKKLILLKRSIRALEKATKVKPKAKSLVVPQVPDGAPEKIDLRRQMSDERNKAEQWMLDYAVQHIVTKLTPARKKRVAMLVEAFEAVVPIPET